MNLADWYQWAFTPQPEGDFILGFVLLAVCLLGLFTQSIWLGVGPKNKYWRKSIGTKPRWLQAACGVGLVLVLARFGGVDLLMAPVWLLLWGVVTFVLSSGKKIQLLLEYRKRIASARREGVDV